MPTSEITLSLILHAFFPLIKPSSKLIIYWTNPLCEALYASQGFQFKTTAGWALVLMCESAHRVRPHSRLPIGQSADVTERELLWRSRRSPCSLTPQIRTTAHRMYMEQMTADAIMYAFLCNNKRKRGNKEKCLWIFVISNPNFTLTSVKD